MKTLTNDRLDETLGGRWQLDPQRSSVEFRAGTSGAWGPSRATSTTTRAGST